MLVSWQQGDAEAHWWTGLGSGPGPGPASQMLLGVVLTRVPCSANDD
jgi:hypothetical protein